LAQAILTMTLRIVTWNCNMALHDKVAPLMALSPDLAVISTCAHPDIIHQKARKFPFTDAVWIGRTETKGLGVFTFNGHSVAVSSLYDPAYELFLPVAIAGRHCFNLLAVWACNQRTPDAGPKNGAPVRAAIRFYRSFMRETPTIVAGDFNHNVICNKPGRENNLALITADMQRAGMVSARHDTTNRLLDREPSPTLMGCKNKEQLYPGDSIFVPEGLQANVHSVTVGKPEDWIEWSDHMPVVVELN
jgi:hypothetical protein